MIRRYDAATTLRRCYDAATTLLRYDATTLRRYYNAAATLRRCCDATTLLRRYDAATQRRYDATTLRLSALRPAACMYAMCPPAPAFLFCLQRTLQRTTLRRCYGVAATLLITTGDVAALRRCGTATL